MSKAGFLPVYLAVGADELKRKVVVERLLKRVAELGDLDFNKDSFTGSATDAQALMSACNTMPFMCEYRLVIVKDADKMPKPCSEALISYLESPCETTIVLLEAGKLAKNTRLYKAVAKVDKKAVIDCAPKNKRDLPAQVRNFALSEGVTITDRAAVELIDMIGESTVHLDTELKKMAAALGRGAVIDIDQVHRFVTRVSEVKPWTFTDALAQRDATKAATLLARMGDQSPFGLLTMSLGTLRDLLVAKDLRGSSTKALASALGKQEWQVRNLPRWADRFSTAELEQAIVDAAELDLKMKTGGDQNALFERWALGLCVPRAK